MVTLSPELDESDINKICKINKNIELITYSTIPLMTTSYCLLGNSNKCYEKCSHKCNSSNSYFLKDRYGFKFRIIPDNIQTLTTIYNSRVKKINCNDFSISSTRIDILSETIDEINSLIGTDYS